ncbi:MAG: Na/Pi cotransporter family protein [Firmicutes bacterium]|nr:Na/Pi cotransporter family protein [Bacillota bacterium]
MEIFTSICMLLGGIAVFLLGIKLMSNGLERGAGKSVKKMFARIGDNRFANSGIGAGATAAIQSSTAVTVMVVGFVNAGVITLLQATAIIMGANVGTTFTAFFGAFAALPINQVFMMSGIVGISLFMFSKKPKLRIAGEIITGLAVIFVGMHLMNGAFPRGGQLRNGFQRVFESLSGNPIGPVLLLLVGAIFTGIIQSSTAATSMAVLMAGQGTLPLEAGIFIILGANIGTCFTALIASIGASSNAKRAALTHLMYNLIGAAIFLPLLWILRSQSVSFLTWIVEALRFPEASRLGFAAAFFHLFYNLILFAMLIGFTRPLTKLVIKMIPAKAGEVILEPQLYHIDEKIHIVSGMDEGTISAAKNSVFQEIANMADMARENIETAFRAALVADTSNKHKIVSVEQKINYIYKGIGRHLVKLSKEGIFKEDEKVFNSLHHVISDIERIGDHAMNFLDEAEDMKENKVVFSESAISDLESMHREVSNMFPLALEIFESRDKQRLEEITGIGKLIGEKKCELGFGHISRLNKDECNVEAGVHFYAIITSLERVKDHLNNIAFSIRSTAGAQLEQLKQLSKAKVKKRSARKKVYW